MVRVYDPEVQREKIVYFDDSNHEDLRRGDLYLRRSAAIRNKRGQLTKDDPRSANFWSRRYLWASGEPYSLFQPPDT